LSEMSKEKRETRLRDGSSGGRVRGAVAKETKFHFVAEREEVPGEGG